MTISDGQFYRTRSGQKVGPVFRRLGRMDVELPWTDGQLAWTKDGRFFNCSDDESEHDLVAESQP